MKLNLEAKTEEQRVVLDYLQENVSDALADKINNGVSTEKDGKHLISKKTLDGFMEYACKQAQEQAEKGARSACVKADVVFGWAIHYFEEDSIVEKLYNEDGTEYEAPKPKVTHTAPIQAKPVVKEKPNQLSFFDELEEIKEEQTIDQETGEILDDDKLSFLKSIFGEYLEVK